MKIDYRKRCVKPNGNFDRIYYGHTAAEYDGPGADKVRDLTSDYAELSVGGRRPGNPIELEKSRHFFNRRID